MRRFIVTVLLLMAGLWASAQAAETAPIRVLIVDGFSNHDWRLTTALIRGILEPTGLFTVTVSTAPNRATDPGWDAWKPPFAEQDVVIQTCNDIGGGPSWPVAVRQALADYVTKGGGLYVFHSANNAFVGWSEYEAMVGLLWRKKDQGTAIAIADDGNLMRIPSGEGLGTGHGKRFDCVVHQRGHHPIHAGFPAAWRAADMEVYYYARGPAENVEVLAFASEPKTAMSWPIEWTVTYGSGRVFVSTYGHVWKGDTQPVAMRCAAMQTIMIRAVQWLAGKPVTYPIPADFPSAEQTSIRGLIPVTP
jgi:type 1 glutamine amidotransferase